MYQKGHRKAYIADV